VPTRFLRNLLLHPVLVPVAVWALWAGCGGSGEPPTTAPEQVPDRFVSLVEEDEPEPEPEEFPDFTQVVEPVPVPVAAAEGEGEPRPVAKTVKVLHDPPPEVESVAIMGDPEPEPIADPEPAPDPEPKPEPMMDPDPEPEPPSRVRVQQQEMVKVQEKVQKQAKRAKKLSESIVGLKLVLQRNRLHKLRQYGKNKGWLEKPPKKGSRHWATYAEWRALGREYRTTKKEVWMMKAGE